MCQIVQMLVDGGASSKLQASLPSSIVGSGTDASGALESLLLRSCHRALDFCNCLLPEYRTSEPFSSFAREFSSPAWVHAAGSALKNTKSPPDVLGAAVSCFRIMAMHKEWMRHWGTFEIFPLLLALSRRPGVTGDLSHRREAIASFHEGLKLMPEIASAMLDLRLIGSDVFVRAVGYEMESNPIETLSNNVLESLVRDANDLSFGSTLKEQQQFAERLNSWVSCNIPTDYVVSCIEQSYNGTRVVVDDHIITEFKRWRVSALHIAEMMSSWLPALCLAVEIRGGNRDVNRRYTRPKSVTAAERMAAEVSDDEKAKRMELSSSIAVRQIEALEKILLASLWLDMTISPDKGSDQLAISTILICLDKSASENTSNDLMKYHDTSKSGLLATLNHLSTAGLYVNSAEALSLQIQFVHLLTSVLRAATSIGDRCNKLLNNLADLGVVRSIVQFLKYEVEVMREVVSSKRFAVYLANDHKRLISATRSAWSALIGSRNAKLYDAVATSGILNLIVEEWMADKTVLSLVSSNAGDGDLSTFVVRVEALELSRIILDHASSGDTVRIALSQVAIESRTIERCISVVWASYGRRGEKVSVETSVSILNLFASFSVENLDVQYGIAGIPKDLLKISLAFSDIHQYTHEVWMKWINAQRKQTVEAPPLPPDSKKESSSVRGSSSVNFEGSEFYVTAIGAKKLFAADKGISFCILSLYSCLILICRSMGKHSS
jgi:hypothetical protein